MELLCSNSVKILKERESAEERRGSYGLGSLEEPFFVMHRVNGQPSILGSGVNNI